MYPKISIIILNWNQWKVTLECLESLHQIIYPNYDIILIDNGSEDGSVEKIKSCVESKILIKDGSSECSPICVYTKILEYTKEEAEAERGSDNEIVNTSPDRKFIIIKNEKNYGYVEGNNIGIKYVMKSSNPDYILILNNDTIVDENFLGQLINVAESDDKIGIVGPKIYYYNTKRIWSTGDMKHSGKIDDGKFDKIIEVKWVNGCASLIKRSVIENVGLLDKDYSIYSEDVDYCTRVIKAGYKLYCAPLSIIWHKESYTKIKPQKVYYDSRNNILLKVKNSKGLGLFNSMVKYLIISYPLYICQNPKYLSLSLRGTLDGLLWWAGIKPAGFNTKIDFSKFNK
jgi:hypothetical protein